MKKIILHIVFLLMATASFSQSDFFDKLEDMDDVTTVVVTKDAFELLKKFPNSNSKDMKVFNMAKGLEELKVFSTENLSLASNMESMVNSAIKKGGLTQLVRVKDKNSRVKIYVKASKNKDIVSEVLMFVKNFDKEDKSDSSSTIISLVGEINMNELVEIANDYEKKK